MLKMSNDLIKKTKSIRAKQANNTYEVGYAKPPVTTQFTKGKSGNPKGRPKGSKNKMPTLNEERCKGIILEEAYREIKIHDGRKEVKIPVIKAVVRSIAVNAARGDQRAQKLLTDLVVKIEADNKMIYDEYLQVMIEYKAGWEEIIEQCKKNGRTPPDPVPHPDHIIIDFENGLVRIIGPLTKEEKVTWDKMRERKAEAIAAIEKYEKELKDPKNIKYIDFIKDEILFEKRILEIISAKIKD
jgi:Family of unknown function (DUF5681)